MLPEARRQQLLDVITRRGFATLEDLVQSTGASESTIRRDLETLDLAGAIKRTHGGAVRNAETNSEVSHESGSPLSDAKRRIGKAAAALVRDGDTVLLDGGTTTLEVARALVGRPVQIVTNSLPIAQMVADRGKTNLILIGGQVDPGTGVSRGPLAIATIQGLRVRQVIMGAGGIMPDGLYNSDSLLVETERAMMACGQEVIVVADASKFGALSLVKLCGLDEVSRFVVDGELNAEFRELLASRGVPVTLASDVEAISTQRNGS